MRRRRAMFPETALYVANYILSSSRATVYEPLYYSRHGKAPVLETFCTPIRAGGGGLPGNTGFSDVVSTQPAGYCRIRHSLVWRYRWRKLKEQMRELRR
ncbi:hypothetical protein ANANG_G00003800 [Anguilla anguilla]|uniref:Uncharacterized protein n=1 Tax=Anguilla anguilla TaxID=7936 RepID=A0A9D3MWD2_ANGAN|nr:hypothetical protein ANANG_G00003800 [Anguilla anguilla]